MICDWSSLVSVLLNIEVVWRKLLSFLYTPCKIYVSVLMLASFESPNEQLRNVWLNTCKNFLKIPHLKGYGNKKYS